LKSIAPIYHIGRKVITWYGKTVLGTLRQTLEKLHDTHFKLPELLIENTQFQRVGST